MSSFLDKNLILDRIKELYQLKNNAKLASFLGIPPTTLSSWYSRNTLDLDIIYEKCVGINWQWLIAGEGSMLRADERPTASVTPSTDAPAASAKPDESILYNMYKDLQAEKEKIRLEKEAKIEELNAKMLAMSEEIGRLKAKLGEEASEDQPKDISKKTAKNAFTKPPSSQSLHDVPFAAAPSDGR